MSSDTPELRLRSYEVLTRPDGSLWELGAGGFGRTFRARHTILGTEVALKVIHDHITGDARVRSRFLREAQAQAQMEHPGIAAITYCDEVDGTLFYVMDLCEGGDFRRLVESGGALPPAEVLEVLRQTAEALQFAHERNLIHRDLKPSSLLLSFGPEGEPVVKLTDFGLGKSTGPNADVSGGLLGLKTDSLAMASPEEIREQPVDARSDLFALGMTGWYLLHGGPPIPGKMAEIIADRLDPEEYGSRLPESLTGPPREILARLIRKVPADRYASTAGLLEDLREAAKALPMPRTDWRTRVVPDRPAARAPRAGTGKPAAAPAAPAPDIAASMATLTAAVSAFEECAQAVDSCLAQASADVAGVPEARESFASLRHWSEKFPAWREQMARISQAGETTGPVTLASAAREASAVASSATDALAQVKTWARQVAADRRHAEETKTRADTLARLRGALASAPRPETTPVEPPAPLATPPAAPPVNLPLPPATPAPTRLPEPEPEPPPMEPGEVPAFRMDEEEMPAWPSLPASPPPPPVEPAWVKPAGEVRITRAAPPPPSAPAKSGAGKRVAGLLFFLAAAGAGGYFAWDKFVKVDGSALAGPQVDRSPPLRPEPTPPRPEPEPAPKPDPEPPPPGPVPQPPPEPKKEVVVVPDPPRPEPQPVPEPEPMPPEPTPEPEPPPVTEFVSVIRFTGDVPGDLSAVKFSGLPLKGEPVETTGALKVTFEAREGAAFTLVPPPGYSLTAPGPLSAAATVEVPVFRHTGRVQWDPAVLPAYTTLLFTWQKPLPGEPGATAPADKALRVPVSSGTAALPTGWWQATLDDDAPGDQPNPAGIIVEARPIAEFAADATLPAPLTLPGTLPVRFTGTGFITPGYEVLTRDKKDGVKDRLTALDRSIPRRSAQPWCNLTTWNRSGWRYPSKLVLEMTNGGVTLDSTDYARAFPFLLSAYSVIRQAELARAKSFPLYGMKPPGSYDSATEALTAMETGMARLNSTSSSFSGLPSDLREWITVVRKDWENYVSSRRGAGSVTRLTADGGVEFDLRFTVQGDTRSVSFSVAPVKGGLWKFEGGKEGFEQVRALLSPR